MHSRGCATHGAPRKPRPAYHGALDLWPWVAASMTQAGNAARGRAILITGASAGIGEQLALEFARRGDRLALAAPKGLPAFGAYGASKAGLSRCLQSVRAEAHASGVHVTELAPGFIDTEMNRGYGPRPCVIPVEKGAAVMARMIDRRVRMRWVPVMPWTFFARLLKLLPAAVVVLRQPPRQ